MCWHFFNSVSLCFFFVCLFCLVFLTGICQVKPRTRKSTKVAKREDRKKKRTEKIRQDGEKKDSDRTDYGWTEQTRECVEDLYYCTSSRASWKPTNKCSSSSYTFQYIFVTKRWDASLSVQNNKYEQTKSCNCVLVLWTNFTNWAADFKWHWMNISSNWGSRYLSCELWLLVRRFRSRHVTLQLVWVAELHHQMRQLGG